MGHSDSALPKGRFRPLQHGPTGKCTCHVLTWQCSASLGKGGIGRDQDGAQSYSFRPSPTDLDRSGVLLESYHTDLVSTRVNPIEVGTGAIYTSLGDHAGRPPSSVPLGCMSEPP